jgi:hypothetical protein
MNTKTDLPKNINKIRFYQITIVAAVLLGSFLLGFGIFWLFPSINPLSTLPRTRISPNPNPSVTPTPSEIPSAVPTLDVTAVPTVPIQRSNIQDRELMQLVFTLKEFVERDDAEALVTFQDTVEELCSGTDSNTNDVCIESPDGASHIAYQINVIGNKSGRVSREQYVQELSAYFASYGPFEFLSARTKDDNALFIFINHNTQYCLQLSLIRSADRWRLVNPILQGSPASYDLCLDPQL